MFSPHILTNCSFIFRTFLAIVFAMISPHCLIFTAPIFAPFNQRINNIFDPFSQHFSFFFSKHCRKQVRSIFIFFLIFLFGSFSHSFYFFSHFFANFSQHVPPTFCNIFACCSSIFRKSFATFLILFLIIIGN